MHLHKITPDAWTENPHTQQFYNLLSKKPYCTNEKGLCLIRTKKHAIKHAYIQPNSPLAVSWLVFDIDNVHGFFSWDDANLPPPHIISQNPDNGHVHLFYLLQTPVFISEQSRLAPLRYLAAIQKAMTDALGADAGYSGLLSKNPVNSKWQSYTTTAEPYSLSYLADWLDLKSAHDKPANEPDYDATGLGRNCTLFETLRHYMYKKTSETRAYKPLYDMALDQALSINEQFTQPLPYSEVRATARSVAKYCSKADFQQSHDAFRELQKQRITKRWGDNTEKKKKAHLLAEQGVKIGQISKEIGVTPRTLTNWGIQRKKK